MSLCNHGLPPQGPLLDDAVAIELMGWKRTTCGYEGHSCAWWCAPNEKHFGLRQPPKYSLLMGLAWQVVERLAGQSVVLNFGEDTGAWECSFIVGGRRFSGFSEFAPTAICHAALLAARGTR